MPTGIDYPALPTENDGEKDLSPFANIFVYFCIYPPPFTHATKTPLQKAKTLYVHNY